MINSKHHLLMAWNNQFYESWISKIFSFTKVFICSRSTKENQNKVWYFWNYFTTLFKAEICRTTWAERSIHQKHDWSKLHAILNHRNTSASFCCMYYKCNAAQAYLSQQDHFFIQICFKVLIFGEGYNFLKKIKMLSWEILSNFVAFSEYLNFI